MDIEKYLVILKGEDKTANIISYEYQGRRLKEIIIIGVGE
jgi:hypothetical protein